MFYTWEMFLNDGPPFIDADNGGSIDGNFSIL
ncbi:MAG: hypothetical protein Ct9H300mP20_03580 [Gammaproteobacteria bacterium]|nr:MAG: hypothetical protein Ct9H300mP20_03580 [Gammaproteobacteria bacterium]